MGILRYITIYYVFDPWNRVMTCDTYETKYVGYTTSKFCRSTMLFVCLKMKDLEA